MKIRLSVLALLVLFLTGCSDTVVQQDYSATRVKEVAPIERQAVPVTKVKADEKPIERQPADVPLSNDNTYINSLGNEVHSPAYAPSVPAGASAICGDGTYSFSQSRRGTCSHHGGVAEWL